MLPFKNVKDEDAKTNLRLEFDRVSVKLKGQEAKLRDFCNKTGLDRDRYREQVFAAKTERGIRNFGKSTSMKAVWGNKRYLTNASQGGKIKKKFNIHAMNVNNKTEFGVFNFVDIENDLLSSSIGQSVLKFIEDKNLFITMDYWGDPPPGIMGQIDGKNITVYATNCHSLEDAVDTIIHEVAHSMYYYRDYERR